MHRLCGGGVTTRCRADTGHSGVTPTRPPAVCLRPCLPPWAAAAAAALLPVGSSAGPRGACSFLLAQRLLGVQGQCGISEFWSSDLDGCMPCASCKQYPKTPLCNTCKVVEETPDVWKLAAISSFSVLAVVLVGAALIIGVMVHRRKAQKLPLREPIEETAGPLYQA
nr:tumor necrosis factor receptor superfamily member 12A-like [Nerophis lumbriciformis]